MKIWTFLTVMFCWTLTAVAQPSTEDIAAAAKKVLPKVIEWRRHLHQNPELSNREFETAKFVEKHLRSLGGGLEIRTGVAHTGVVAILKGGLPGPVVALRADMDGRWT